MVGSMNTNKNNGLAISICFGYNQFLLDAELEFQACDEGAISFSRSRALLNMTQ
jgi:hypothetical protein